MANIIKIARPAILLPKNAGYDVHVPVLLLPGRERPVLFRRHRQLVELVLLFPHRRRAGALPSLLPRTSACIFRSMLSGVLSRHPSLFLLRRFLSFLPPLLSATRSLCPPSFPFLGRPPPRYPAPAPATPTTSPHPPCAFLILIARRPRPAYIS